MLILQRIVVGLFFILTYQHAFGKTNGVLLKTQVVDIAQEDPSVSTAHPNEVSLLKSWKIYSKSAIKKIPTYNRRKHFGSWKLRQGCHDTRALVLIREDDDGVVKRSKRWPCHVIGGEWLDPYSGKWINKASQVHIDHVIPLKNAYVSGGWKWSKAKRCHYGNYMENDVHLLAVSAFENRSKGERDPSEYLPIDEDFHCDYLRMWLLNKKIWKLQMSREELIFIRQKLKSLRCESRLFRVDRDKLDEQRKLTDKIPKFCIE